MEDHGLRSKEEPGANPSTEKRSEFWDKSKIDGQI